MEEETRLKGQDGKPSITVVYRVTLPAPGADVVSGLSCFAIKAKVNSRESMKRIPTTLGLKSNGGFHPNLTRLITGLNSAEVFASSCSSAFGLP